MQYYRLYSSIAAIALGIHLIINWQQLTARKNRESRPGARECSAFLLCLALFFVSDILWGIFAGLGFPRLLFADTTVFFLALALSVFAWTRYVIVYLEMNGGLRECMRWAGNSLLALIIAGLTVNCFTGIFFAVDAYGDYSSGPLRHLALVRDVVGACEVIRMHKTLTLKTEIDEMPLVSVDPQRVRQILFNLLSNAYKYTDRGTVTLRVRRHDGTLTLSVADTGKGIAPEDIRRIFQPFVQLADKNHRNGTGLGLPICQKLARLMGGELTVESTVGAGSTFTVTLPDIPTAEPLVRQERTAHPAAPAHSAHRILIADDSPVNRAVLKAMLARIGVGTVETAQNGREALALLKRGPEFDLLLSDLWMPEMDGRELVRAVRADAQLAHLPVYLVTADVESRSQVEADGFTGILFKPVTLEKLRTVWA